MGLVDMKKKALCPGASLARTRPPRYLASSRCSPGAPSTYSYMQDPMLYCMDYTLPRVSRRRGAGFVGLGRAGPPGEVGSDGPHEAVVLEEERLDGSPAEEAHRSRDGGDGVGVLADERAAEDDVLHLGLLRVEGGNLRGASWPLQDTVLLLV